jgi:predicted Fe-Mo cluster-binding NifX family protein
MMRLAIPIFHHRVSPLLDTCTRLLIIDFEDQAEVDRREVVFDMYSPSERLEILKKLNPDAVICCGISEVFDRMLQAASIRLVCGIAGDVQQVVEAFLCNRLDAPCFRMPGFKPGDGL